MHTKQEIIVKNNFIHGWKVSDLTTKCPISTGIKK